MINAAPQMFEARRKTVDKSSIDVMMGLKISIIRAGDNSATGKH